MPGIVAPSIRTSALVDIATARDDEFAGTVDSDFFDFSGNVGGNDRIDGMGGVDRLLADFRSAMPTRFSAYSTIASSGGSLSGLVYAGENAVSLAFRTMEDVDLTIDNGDPTIVVDTAAVAAGAELALDGAGGYDWLQIGLAAFSDTTLTVADDGRITTNLSGLTLDGFERFAISLGSGSNTVTTGGGRDSINGGAGIDRLDGGAGDDSIQGGGGRDILRGGSSFDSIATIGNAELVDGEDGADSRTHAVSQAI